MWKSVKEAAKRTALDRGFRTAELRPGRVVERFAKARLANQGYEVRRVNSHYPVVTAMDTNRVELLKDPAFHASLLACAGDTNLDDNRLANLWMYAQLSGPGSMMEIGTWHGGGALHIANAQPHRTMFVFDPFSDRASFESLDPGLDSSFDNAQFTDTSEEYVRTLFERNNRPVTLVPGFFPASAENLDVAEIAFCHLDVDVYEATRRSLDFVAARLAPRSFILLDDYRREAAGVDRAVAEFLADHPDFRCFPLHPSQAVVFSLPLWS